MFLKCVPPKTTAQQKGVAMGKFGKPRFYTKDKMASEQNTWRVLMAEHVPAVPMDGALSLFVKFIYPHKKATSRKYRQQLWPKLAKPDCTNIIKGFEDQLVSMRFVIDDARFFRVTAEKWHGPDDAVGIEVVIEEGV